MHTASSVQSQRSLELALPRGRDKQPVDSSDFKDPCDMRGRRRERGKESVKPICIPSCQTLSEFFYSPLSSLSLSLSPRKLSVFSNKQLLYMCSPLAQLCKTNLRTKVLDCLALLCFLLAGLTSLSLNPSGKHLLFQETLSSFFSPRRLRTSSTISLFQG